MKFSEIKNLVQNNAPLFASVLFCDGAYSVSFSFQSSEKSGDTFFLTHSKYEFLGQKLTFSTLDGAANQLKKLGFTQFKVSL